VAAGYFEGSAAFGGTSKVSAGLRDMFVVSVSSSNGTVGSTRSYGSSGNDEARGVGVDGAGNVVLVGTFQGSVSFGGASLTSAGMSDIVLARYSTSGAHQGSQSFGGSGSEIVTGLAVNATGAIAMTGSFATNLDLGGGMLPMNGSWNAFVARFTASGSPRWSIGAGLLYDDHGNGVAISASGDVVATGDFYQGADFGGLDLVNVGGADGYLARFWP